MNCSSALIATRSPADTLATVSPHASRSEVSPGRTVRYTQRIGRRADGGIGAARMARTSVGWLHVSPDCGLTSQHAVGEPLGDELVAIFFDALPSDHPTMLQILSVELLEASSERLGGASLHVYRCLAGELTADRSVREQDGRVAGSSRAARPPRSAASRTHRRSRRTRPPPHSSGDQTGRGRSTLSTDRAEAGRACPPSRHRSQPRPRISGELVCRPRMPVDKLPEARRFACTCATRQHPDHQFVTAEAQAIPIRGRRRSPDTPRCTQDEAQRRPSTHRRGTAAQRHRSPPPTSGGWRQPRSANR